MLPVLVVHRLVLNLAALVHRVHRAEHTAAFGDALEFLVDGFLDQVGQLIDDETSSPWILADVQGAFILSKYFRA